MAYFGWPISQSIRKRSVVVYNALHNDRLRYCSTYANRDEYGGRGGRGSRQADNGRDSGPSLSPPPSIGRTTTSILDDHEGDNNNEDDRMDDRDEDRRQ